MLHKGTAFMYRAWWSTGSNALHTLGSIEPDETLTGVGSASCEEVPCYPPGLGVPDSTRAAGASAGSGLRSI